MGVVNSHTSSILSGGLEMLVMFVELLKSLNRSQTGMQTSLNRRASEDSSG